ncbi:M1 family metallopeptidase [Baia soyae]|uniref:Peptidase M1-like protein n=1 Tax=Baia soyae TaxID=1544746 RepID=A0A4R2S2M2_9BACL|nr:M1 family metallopeptidase [Baia soyae]TCP70034.1 peptidase M1-like protein [Baia soyae]
MKKWTNIAIAGSILSSITLSTIPLHADAMEKPNQIDRPQYQIDAKLDQKQHRIQASETVSFKNKYGQNLNDLVFHLYPDSYNKLETMSNMQAKPNTPEMLAEIKKKYPNVTEKDFLGDIEVKSVTIQGKKVSYTQEKQALKIQLATPLQPHQQIDVKIDFTVTIPFGFQRMNHRDGFYALTKWYPILSMYDPKVKKWDENPYHPDGESDYSDFSDYKMKLTVPKEMTVAATGIEKETIQQNEKIVQVDAPNVREFVFFASPHYTKETRKIAGTTVNSYYDKRNPQSKEISLTGLKSVEKAIPFFNQKFGQYDYPEFDIMETRVMGADMEYPTIIQMGEYSNEGANMSLVHELAHQWFYGMIGNNPYRDPALDESFTTFADMYFHEYDTKGKYGFKTHLSYSEKAIKGMSGAINRPLDQYPSSSDYNEYVYGKGYIALIDLYYKVGEKKFDQIMKTYFAQNKFTNATFANFFEAVHKIAGKEVKDYMEKAFTKPGYHPTHLIQPKKETKK